VRIHEVGQLFNSIDPSPFTERDLDDDAEAYIVGWAREVDAQGPFRIVVHLPTNEVSKARERGIWALPSATTSPAGSVCSSVT
jgi:hypothetical protein